MKAEFVALKKEKKEVPQTKKLKGRKKEMVKNHAGGAVFKITPLAQVRRFLVMGTDTSTFYADKKTVAKENAEVLIQYLKDSSPATIKELVDEIVDVSNRGLAVSNDPALFALAMCSSPKYVKNTKARSYALANLNAVVRVFPHLTAFLEYAKVVERGWGAAFKRAIGNWYTEKTPNNLAYQMVKYRQRDGWTHKDVLLKASPVPDDPAMESIFRWGVKATFKARKVDRNGVIKHYPSVKGVLPSIIDGYELAKNVTTASKAVELIEGYGLTHEMLPKDMLAHKSVWRALVEDMPLRATLWNLGRLSSHKLINPMSDLGNKLIKRLTNEEYIHKSRIHPITILIAMKGYAKGEGTRGNLTWDVNQNIVEALDKAFYLSFANVKPTGKRVLLALDVSSSMGWSNDSLVLTSAEISVAMAMVTAKTEESYYIMGFSSTFKDLQISSSDTLQSAQKKTSKMNFGGTDCSLPMLWGMHNKIEFDACVIYTDSETWAGRIHPSIALQQYREEMGIPTRLIVCATASTGFSIADPKDPGMLDVVGFSADTPNLISSFIREDF